MGAQQDVPFLVTLVGIITFGMLTGIAIGIVMQIRYNLSKSHRNALQLTRYDDHYVLRFQQNLTFMHNPRLQGLLNAIPENSVVIVDNDNAEYIDADVKAVLKDFGDNADKHGIRLSQWLVAVK